MIQNTVPTDAIFDKSQVKSLVSNKLKAGKGKRIIVFENGNERCNGHQIAINPIHHYTLNSMLTDIGSIIKPKFGAVRYLKTEDGTKNVETIDDLIHDEKYVACGREKYIKIKGG